MRTSQAAEKAVSPGISLGEIVRQSTRLGSSIQISLQVIVGISFIVALVGSVRRTGAISLAAMMVDVIFLLLTFLVIYLISTRRIDLKLAHYALLNFLPILIVLGVALRVSWVLAVPPVQTSDFRDYTELARTLLNTGSYVDFETGNPMLAFRPPGYPVFLAACISLLGDNTWTPAVSNIVMFLVSVLLLNSAARALGGRRAALAALLLFVLWPSDIFITGLAASEPFTLLLFTAGLWLFSLCDVHGAKASIVAGIVGGVTALTRPTMLLFPLLWAVFALVGPNFKGRLRHVVIATLLMVATIAPWTLRNYRVLHAFVPVSTNGGDVFYRANNGLATGSYTPAAEEDLGELQDQNEAIWDQESYKRGKNWIRSHPFGFVKLVVFKAIFFGQDDQTGIYWSLRRGHHSEGRAYMALGVLSDAWWQFLCSLGLLAVWRGWRGFLPDARATLFASGYALLVLVHLVYESQSRYRMPAIGVLIAIIVASLCKTSRAADFRVDMVGP